MIRTNVIFAVFSCPLWQCATPSETSAPEPDHSSVFLSFTVSVVLWKEKTWIPHTLIHMYGGYWLFLVFLTGVGCCCSIMKRHPMSPICAIFIAWQKVGIALVVYDCFIPFPAWQLESSCIGMHIWCCLPLYGSSKTLRDDSVVTDEEGAMFAQQCELL